MANSKRPFVQNPTNLDIYQAVMELTEQTDNLREHVFENLNRRGEELKTLREEVTDLRKRVEKLEQRG